MSTTPHRTTKESTASTPIRMPRKRNTNDVGIGKFCSTSGSMLPLSNTILRGIGCCDTLEERSEDISKGGEGRDDETIDLDEIEDSFGDLKPPKSFDPID
ncbi:hypothetical protein Tco_0818006 [Tanacetum coccineum]